MRRRRALASFALGALAALTVTATAFAGGFAIANLDSTPSDPQPRKPIQIGFTLLQHGETPINWANVTLAATNRDTGERVTAPARPQGKAGHYVVSVTFPSAGTWDWNLESADIQITSSFPALKVGAIGGAPVAKDAGQAKDPAPDAAANPAPAGSTGPAVSREVILGGAAVVLAVIVGGFVLLRRRTGEGIATGT